MAKSDRELKRSSEKSTAMDTAAEAGSIEQRVVAFAEQLGRMAGTVQARAEGWMESETLRSQIASVRDAATDLLGRLTGGPTSEAETPTTAAVRQPGPGRSGGVVDAPGKKHRKPTPSDPRAKKGASRTVKARSTREVVKRTPRRRG